VAPPSTWRGNPRDKGEDSLAEIGRSHKSVGMDDCETLNWGYMPSGPFEITHWRASYAKFFGGCRRFFSVSAQKRARGLS